MEEQGRNKCQGSVYTTYGKGGHANVIVGTTYFWRKLCTLRRRIMHSALAKTKNLRKRRVLVKPECYLCGQEREIEAHLFRYCELIKRVWRISAWAQVDQDYSVPFQEWLPSYLLHMWKIEGAAHKQSIFGHSLGYMAAPKQSGIQRRPSQPKAIL